MRSLLHFFDTPAGRVVRYLVSFGIVAAFVVLVDWGELAQLEGRFAWGPVLWATLIAGVTYPLHALRWRLLYVAQGLMLSFSWSHAVTWIGNFYNSILLGGLGGDAARVFYVCRDAPRQKTAGVASIALDRLLGLGVLLMISLVALAAKLSSVALKPELRTFALICSLALVLGTAAVAVAFSINPQRWPHGLRTRMGESRMNTLADLRARTLANRRAHGLAWFVCLAIWLLDFYSVWLLAVGLGLNLPFIETCIAVSVAYAATALPLSVGGHGVREGALLFTLGVFDLISTAGPDRDAALLLALLVWAVTMIWSLFGGIILLVWRPVRLEELPPSS